MALAKLYVNGKKQEISVTIDTLTKTTRTEKPLWIGNGHPLAKFKGQIDEARIYDRVLSEEEIARLQAAIAELEERAEEATARAETAAG